MSWNSGESGGTRGGERTIVSRGLIERVIAALLDDDMGVRMAAVAEVIDACPSWWTDTLPVPPHGDADGVSWIMRP